MAFWRHRRTLLDVVLEGEMKRAELSAQLEGKRLEAETRRAEIEMEHLEAVREQNRKDIEHREMIRAQRREQAAKARIGRARKRREAASEAPACRLCANPFAAGLTIEEIRAHRTHEPAQLALEIPVSTEPGN